ncbi:MAG: hypothetical protein HY871_05750 [Chloroflexi bacterium]|nr:hypothetical protein [Chloroflexota bacterium]
MLDRRNICPCYWHKDEIAQDGHCRCHLFVDDKYDPATAYAPVLDQSLQVARANVRLREITIYLTWWCPRSRRTKGLLKKYDVPCREIDIERSRSGAQRAERWNDGNQSVPTLDMRLVVTEPSDAALAGIFNPKARVQSLTMYTTDWCHDVRRARAFLQGRGIPYQDVDIERDPRAAAQVEEWNQGYQSVPTLDVCLVATEPTEDELARILCLV